MHQCKGSKRSRRRDHTTHTQHSLLAGNHIITFLINFNFLLDAISKLLFLFPGGIGGVHRGAEQSFDVSADLTELGRTNVAVVSSGVNK